MKSIFRLLMMLLLSTALFTSCKKSAPKQTKHIPKNAVFVAAINTGAITKKMANSQATLETLFNSMADSDTAITKGKQEWEDFKNSGINLSENFYVAVVQKDGNMQSGNNIVTGIGALEDAGKLEAYIKKKSPETQVKKEKDYSYAAMEDNNIVAWRDDLVLVMSNTPAAGQMSFDSTTGQFNMQQPASSEADLKAEILSYFNMKEDESVASIPEFRELMKDNADGSFWVNSASSLENMQLPLPKVKELVENSFTAATLNFEDGKIVMNSKSYTSPAMNDILKKYAGPAVDLGSLQKYPSNNINGFFSFAFNPQMIVAIINHMEMKAMADAQLSQMFGGAYTIEDLTKAIKGDMTMIVSDFSMPGADTAKAPRSASPMKMVVNIPIGDKTQMNRLMDKLVEMGMMVKTGNEYRATEAISRTGYQVIVDDKNILAASDIETLNQYRAGTAKAAIGADILDEFKGKVAVGYINIESLLNAVPVNANDAQMSEVMPKAKATFRDAKGYAENFNGKYTAGHMELRFKNEKENSLVSLLQFFGEVGKATKKNGGRFQFGTDDSIAIDSIVTE